MVYIGQRDYNNRVERAANELSPNPPQEEILAAANRYGVRWEDVANRRGQIDKPKEHYVSDPGYYSVIIDGKKYTSPSEEFLQKKIDEYEESKRARQREEYAAHLFTKQGKPLQTTEGGLGVIEPTGERTTITPFGDIVTAPKSAYVDPFRTREYAEKPKTVYKEIKQGYSIAPETPFKEVTKKSLKQDIEIETLNLYEKGEKKLSGIIKRFIPEIDRKKYRDPLFYTVTQSRLFRFFAPPKLERGYKQTERTLAELQAGYWSGFREKPLKTTFWTGATFGISGIFRVGGAVLAAKGIKIWKPIKYGFSVGLPALYGISSAKEITITPKGERAFTVGQKFSTEITPMIAGGVAGEMVFPKAIGYVRTRGRTKIEAEKITQSTILQGKKQFPTAPTRSHLRLFKESRYKLPTGPNKQTIYKIGLGKKQFTAYPQRMPGYTGKYYSKTGKIYYTTEKIPKSELKHTLLHELGHKLQGEYFPKLKQDFLTIPRSETKLIARQSKIKVKQQGYSPSESIEEVYSDILAGYMSRSPFLKAEHTRIPTIYRNMQRAFKEMPFKSDRATIRKSFVQEKAPLGVWHASPGMFPKVTTTQAGSSELPGLYTSPSLSPHFLKISGEKISLFSSELFPKSSPTILRIYPKGITGLTGSRSDMKKFLTDKAIKGKVYVPRIKTEVEGIMPPGTPLGRVGSRYYTTYKGVRVPIEEYKPLGTMKGQSFTGQKSTTAIRVKEYYGYSKASVIRPTSFIKSGYSSYKVTKPSKIYLSSKSSQKVSYVRMFTSSKVSTKRSVRDFTYYSKSYSVVSRVTIRRGGYSTISTTKYITVGYREFRIDPPPPNIKITTIPSPGRVMQGVRFITVRQTVRPIRKFKYTASILPGQYNLRGAIPKIRTGVSRRPLRWR